MSNLSQFFAAGGNKIKKIQRVQATQTVSGSAYSWASISVGISAVDVNKTILVYNTNASNERFYSTGTQFAVSLQYNHYPFLSNSTTITFNGPSSFSIGGLLNPTPARLEVQIIEFE